MSEETMSEADKAIARVWKALGVSAYAESGGLEISQIVAKRVAELAEARAEIARKDAELATVDEALSRRSALENAQSRHEAICMAYARAGQADKAEAERDAYKAKLDEAFSYLSIAYHNVPDVVTGWDSAEWLDRVQTFLAVNKPAPATKEK